MENVTSEMNAEKIGEQLKNSVDYSTFKIAPDLNAQVLSETGVDLASVDKMLSQQKEINVKVDPNWTTKNYDWKTAILVELAEGIDSTPWKWWKKGSIDWINLEIELVDKMFFINAKMIEMNMEENVKIFFMNQMIHEKNNPIKVERTLDVATKAKVLMRDEFLRILALDYYLVLIPTWFKIWNAIGNDTERLFKLYALKFTLNQFRQDHGYKDGSYIKMWNGVEDNKAAIALSETIAYDENYVENLTAALETAYANLTPVQNEAKELKTFEQFLTSSQKHNVMYNTFPEEMKKVLKDYVDSYIEFTK